MVSSIWDRRGPRGAEKNSWDTTVKRIPVEFWTEFQVITIGFKQGQAGVQEVRTEINEISELR